MAFAENSEMTKEKTTRIILHIVIWTVFLALPIYSARRFRMGSEFLLIFYTFTAVNALMFYANYLFLVPRLFFRKKKFRYYIAALALIFGFYFVSEFANREVFGFISKSGNQEQIKDQPGRAPDTRAKPSPPPLRGIMRPRLLIPDAHTVGYISSSVFMVFLSLGIRVLERQSKIEKMQEVMEKEKLNAELALLKNQISPHFFFNTLNNIYSLVSINPDDAQKAILKLSKLMRYLLYESEHGNTRLSREIEFMNNYIDLMKLRMNEKVLLSVEFPDQTDDPVIPPLLFIPFIENAFKHGVSYREKSFITIRLTAEKDAVSFICINSEIKGKEKYGDNSGIGLENVRKRLALLFPDKHELKISKPAGEYEVLLKIRLS